jgi:hypothetical protein
VTPEDFWTYVSPEPNTGCWLWTGAGVGTGYGYGKVRNAGGSTVTAHRMAWELTNGAIPAGLFVLHRCDNPPCVLADKDPAKSHLFLGTAAENSADMRRKGRSLTGDRNNARVYRHRMARGERNGARRHPDRVSAGVLHAFREHPESIQRGEDAPSSRLTALQVIEIRALYASGGIRQKDLARRFGVHVMTINDILKSRTWRHLA